MAKVKTNDIKKGSRVRLRNGFAGTMADNRKGNIRMVDTEGYFRETGSVYAHDIIAAVVDGQWVDVEYSKGQIQLRQMLNGAGF